MVEMYPGVQLYSGVSAGHVWRFSLVDVLQDPGDLDFAFSLVP